MLKEVSIGYTTMIDVTAAKLSHSPIEKALFGSIIRMMNKATSSVLYLSRR